MAKKEVLTFEQMQEAAEEAEAFEKRCLDNSLKRMKWLTVQIKKGNTNGRKTKTNRNHLS